MDTSSDSTASSTQTKEEDAKADHNGEKDSSPKEATGEHGDASPSPKEAAAIEKPPPKRSAFPVGKRAVPRPKVAKQPDVVYANGTHTTPFAEQKGHTGFLTFARKPLSY